MRWWGWRIWLGVGVGLCAAYYLAPPAPAKLVVWPVIGLSSAAAIVVGARWHRPTPAVAWYLLAGALVSLTTGDTLYNVRVRLLHSGQVFPSLVDLWYLLTYPMLILGLVLLIRRRSPGRDIPSLIDAAIITIGVGLLSWVFLIAPYVHARELSLAQRLVSIAYPLGDVLVLAVATRLAIGTGRRHPHPGRAGSGLAVPVPRAQRHLGGRGAGRYRLDRLLRGLGRRRAAPQHDRAVQGGADDHAHVPVPAAAGGRRGAAGPDRAADPGGARGAGRHHPAGGGHGGVVPAQHGADAWADHRAPRAAGA